MKANGTSSTSRPRNPVGPSPKPTTLRGASDPAGYANPALWGYWVSGPNLSNLRFCYAQEAIRLEGAYVTATLAHSQLVNCIRGINLVSVVVSSGSSGAGVYLTVNNALLANVGWALTQSYSTGSGSGGSATFNHCSVAQANVLISTAQFFTNSFKNSIFAGVTSLGVPTPSGSYNGFYPETQDSFGTYQTISNDDPFQSSGGGAYYLRADSEFREKGTTAGLPATLLTALKSKATQPPIELPRFMLLSGELTLFPQTARYDYESGPPDLGYWYDALDYTVAAMIVDGGKINVMPGTAIGIRQELVGDGSWWELWPFPYTHIGFDLWNDSVFISHGMPNRPIAYASTRMVQEQADPDLASYRASLAWADQDVDTISFVAAFDPADASSAPPSLDFRFSNFHATGRNNFHVAAGHSWWLGWTFSPVSCLHLRMRDCSLQAGGILLGTPHILSNPFDVWGEASIDWSNNLFDRVDIMLDPTYFADGFARNVDMSLNAHNNLFRGQAFFFNAIEPSAGYWTFKDNLFDKVAFEDYWDLIELGPSPIDHDYNGYWPRLESGLVEGWQMDRMAPDAPHDQVLTSAPTYYVGPLGSYYRAPSGPLYQTGSRTAAEAGLAQYTIQPNQTKNNAGSPVSIGLHYVATASYSSAQPKDADGDGIPDYVEDANGDGQWDEGLETKINDAYTLADPSTHDSVNAIYDDIDLDGDVMVGRIEKALGTNPLMRDNPLTLTRGTTVDEPGIASFNVPVNFALLAGLGEIRLSVDGDSRTAAFQESEPNSDGDAQLTWNTIYDWPGQHYVQAQFILSGQSRKGAALDSTRLIAMGPLTQFAVNNVMKFNPFYTEYDDSGAILHAELAEADATYTIELRDPSDPQAPPIRTFSGSTSTGEIEENWDLKYADGASYLGNSVNAIFAVTLKGSGASGSVELPKQKTFFPFEGKFTVAYAWDVPWEAQGSMRTAIQHGRRANPCRGTGASTSHLLTATWSGSSCRNCERSPGTALGSRQRRRGTRQGDRNGNVCLSESERRRQSTSLRARRRRLGEQRRAGD